jgi:hypothetical protein
MAATSVISTFVYIVTACMRCCRCIDFKTRTVTTLAGDGTQGRDYRGGGVGRAQQLSSPWDVELTPDGRELLIAMAGSPLPPSPMPSPLYHMHAEQCAC